MLGVPEGDNEALLSEDGALEPAKGGFSIEPFVWVSGSRIAARERATQAGLEGGDVPNPVGRRGNTPISGCAYAPSPPPTPIAYVSYRVENPAEVERVFELWLAVRPMQVLPTWQSLNLAPGFSPIHEIASDGTVVRITAIA